MVSALFAFLGGSAFRLIFGAVMEAWNKHQEHVHEMEMAKLQSELEAARHDRDMARLQKQSDLQVREVEVQTAATISVKEMDAFLEAVKKTGDPTGVWWVDAWNGSIRPAGATISILIWVAAMVSSGLVLSEFDQTLISAFLGIFVGERIHARITGRPAR